MPWQAASQIICDTQNFVVVKLSTNSRSVPASCSMNFAAISVVAAAALLRSAAALQLPPTGYSPIESLTDEFTGNALDLTKWAARDGGWLGRQPGLFDPGNVVVGGGALQLWAREFHRNASTPAGYDNYTTAAVHSITQVHLGYFEIRWRSGSSGISSSWWLHDSNGTEWTEIDVFETTGVDNSQSGGARAGELPSHVHIFDMPGTNASGLPELCNCTEGKAGSPPCSKPAVYSLPSGSTFSDSFHVAGLLWEASGIKVYLDGALVSEIPSPCLSEAIGMDFDRETMPGWMSLPDPSTLPDQPFLVDYVRSWAPPAT